MRSDNDGGRGVCFCSSPDDRADKVQVCVISTLVRVCTVIGWGEIGRSMTVSLLIFFRLKQQHYQLKFKK